MKQQLEYEVLSKALLPFMMKVTRKPPMKTTNRTFHLTKINHSHPLTKKDHSCLVKELLGQLH